MCIARAGLNGLLRRAIPGERRVLLPQLLPSLLPGVPVRLPGAGAVSQVDEQQLHGVHHLRKLPIGQPLLPRMAKEERRDLLRRHFTHSHRLHCVDESFHPPHVPLPLVFGHPVPFQQRQIPVPAGGVVGLPAVGPGVLWRTWSAGAMRNFRSDNMVLD